jgi:hypothetical protein
MTSPELSSPSSQRSLSEKGDAIHVEDGKVAADSQLYNPHVDVSGVDERALMRKVDLRTIPWLSFLYLLCFLDRTSIGNAKVSLPDLRSDLKLTLS